MEPLLIAFFTGITLAQAIRFAKEHNLDFENVSPALFWIFVAFCWGNARCEWGFHIPVIVGFIACGAWIGDMPGWLLCSPVVRAEKRFRTADVPECREIIKSGTPPDVSKNALSALEARARPNQRLNLAFGIDSCFTSSDEKACKGFRDEVEKLLYVDESKWVELASAAKATAKCLLDVNDKANTAHLFGVVQLLTFKTMMKVLWPEQLFEHITHEQVLVLAQEVNLQWVRSKDGSEKGDKPTWLFDNQKPLRDAVKVVFPDWDETDSKKNPCNLILPGYETMWRVVLRCFVEVMARGHDQRTVWKNVLQAFLENPTRRQLKEPASGAYAGVEAAHIAQEALRLYPPTRRIYREHRDATDQKTNVSADIEAMQRDPAVWKDHPELFVPERWIGVEEGYDHGYMPFGAKPFNCPAKRWKNVPMPFGVSMIAILIGALVEATEGKWKVRGKFPNRKYPLDTDREAYGENVLRKL